MSTGTLARQYSAIVLLALCTGLDDQGRGAAVLAQAATAAASEYICPMHPDVRSPKAGTCPRCGMALRVRGAVSDNYSLQLAAEPRAPRPGQPARLRFIVRSGDERVAKFDNVHERPFHAFIVSDDLRHFDHVHPVLQPDGSLEVTTVLPFHARYQIYADFLPATGAPQFIPHSLYTAGPPLDPLAARPRLVEDIKPKSAGNAMVELQLPPGAGLVAGELQGFRFHFRDAGSGQPLRDLQAFLGASAHLLVVSEDGVDGLHGHPSMEFSSTAGPDVVFEAVFPRPGLHRVWVQFQREGRVEVASFIVTASAAPSR